MAEQLSLFDLVPEQSIEYTIDSFLETTNPWWLTGIDSPRITVSSDLKNIFKSTRSFQELNEKLFWRQINSIRKKYNQDQNKRIRGLRSIVYFYIYIIKNNPELKLFEDARTLYPALLENRSFVTEWLENNCAFLTFQPGLTYDGHEQFIFIIRGANRESTKLKEVDYKKVDLSFIHSPFYRQCVFGYMCSSINRLVNYNPTIFNYCLNLISELKHEDKYINKSEDYLIPSEINLMIEGLRIKCKKREQQVQTYKSTFKSFLQWCVNNKYLNVDNKVFDEFKRFTGRVHVPKTSRPEAEHLDALLDASKKDVEKNPSNIVFDTIIRLILSMKLRISEICGLKRDSILPQLKPNTYRIKYVSKTSHGDENTTSPLTLREKKLLDNVMAYNEHLVEKANTENKNDIFIYIPYRKKSVRAVDKFSFGLYLKRICKENNLPNITATQLRKEYQSQASRFARDKKLNDAELKSLSGHSHIDTTEKHYVKTRLEEYFEEFYMIQLHEHELNIKDKIKKDIPDKLEKVGDTTHKCGACNATECIIRNALPCFVCKDFITSSEYLPIFKNMVEEIDERIIKSNNLHDKEDLTAVKEILVKYIIELSNIS